MTPETLTVVGCSVAILAVMVTLHVRLTADVAELRRELRGEVAGVRGEVAGVRGEVAGVRSELRGDMAELRTELRGDMAELRTELRGDLAEVRGDLAALSRDVASQGERLARIEGAVLGPWRPPEPDPAGEKPA